MKVNGEDLGVGRRPTRLTKQLGAFALATAVAATAVTAGSASATATPTPPPLLGMPRVQSEVRENGGGQVALGGPSTAWNWPLGTTYRSFAQAVTIESTTTPNAPFFWAYQFTTPREQGYVGLQSHSTPNASKIALMSLWGGDRATGPSCGPFEEFGTGYSCRIDPFEWVPGREYVVHISLGTKDATGRWYRGSVTDTASSVTRTIGRVHVPAGGTGSFRGWVSWTEFFGTHPATCPEMPRARGQFRYPTANGGGVRIASHLNQVDPGDCQATIQDLVGAVRHLYPT